jgi:hypothetical protein
VTAVPLKTMFVRSPSGTGPASGLVDFVTGADSPVSAASAICSDDDVSRRASAPTESPSERARRSPGTSSAADTRSMRPSRTTEAVTAVISFSAATASAAFASCA